MKLSVGRLYHTCKNSLGTFKANRCRVYLDRGSCCFYVHTTFTNPAWLCFLFPTFAPDTGNTRPKFLRFQNLKSHRSRFASVTKTVDGRMWRRKGLSGGTCCTSSVCRGNTMGRGPPSAAEDITGNYL